MREIKFRAWLKDWKRMVYTSPPASGGDSGYGGDHIKYIDFWDNSLFSHHSNYWFNHPDQENLEDKDACILMQYTGLKDKNGVEIFDGDVVRIEKFRNAEKHEGLHHWTEVNIVRYIPPEFLMICLKTSDSTKTAMHESFKNVNSYRDTIEIIGNIYENPELLEVKP